MLPQETSTMMLSLPSWLLVGSKVKTTVILITVIISVILSIILRIISVIIKVYCCYYYRRKRRIAGPSLEDFLFSHHGQGFYDSLIYLLQVHMHATKLEEMASVAQRLVAELKTRATTQLSCADHPLA